MGKNVIKEQTRRYDNKERDSRLENESISERGSYSKKVIQYNNLNTDTPMKHLFTSEEMRPSAKTIFFIKQLAYTYRAFNKNESCKAYIIN